MFGKLNSDRAVDYHYGKFPPAHIDYAQLVKSLSAAATALARYDAVLRSLHNGELLLAPLRRSEAVISSRMEGTVTTLDEILLYEAEEDDVGNSASVRNDVIEVYSYARALNHAQRLIESGLPISTRLIREAHGKLLFFGRGADKNPGHFKTDQNYITDYPPRHIYFVPIKPAGLEEGLAVLERLIHNEHYEPLTKTGLAHVEFEALHPFKDGNGRVGRMLITLMLWDQKLISTPHLYISGYFENNKNEYIDLMRAVSAREAWTEWLLFFFTAIEKQAEENLKTADSIVSLYNEMKERFRKSLASQWTGNVLDYVFENPIFNNSDFVRKSSIPRPTAAKLTRILLDDKLLTTIRPHSGRQPAIYAFEPLLQIVRKTT